MDVSIIVVSFNTRDLLRDCLNSVINQTTCSYELIVVDNASIDDSCYMVEQEFTTVQLIKNYDNRGFAAANNQAAHLARGKYLFLLNSDTILENNAIDLLFEFLNANPSITICGPLLLNADGTIQQSIDKPPTILSLTLHLVLGPRRTRFYKIEPDSYHPDIFDYSITQQIKNGWLTGAALMINREDYLKLGSLDESYHFFMEDADFGLNATRAGAETWFFPKAIITHLLGGSRRSLDEDREIAIKIKVLKQQQYYIYKNFGERQTIQFNALTALVFLINLIRRSIQVTFSAPKVRQLFKFKRRLAWKLFLTSIGTEF